MSQNINNFSFYSANHFPIEASKSVSIGTELSLHKYVFVPSHWFRKIKFQFRYESIKFSRYMHIVYSKNFLLFPKHSCLNIDRVEWIQSLTFQWERFYASLKPNILLLLLLFKIDSSISFTFSFIWFVFWEDWLRIEYFFFGFCKQDLPHICNDRFADFLIVTSIWAMCEWLVSFTDCEV